MKLLNFLFFSFILYEIFAKDKDNDMSIEENELIEDDEFVYSNVEEIQKNKQEENMKAVRLDFEKRIILENLKKIEKEKEAEIKEQQMEIEKLKECESIRNYQYDQYYNLNLDQLQPIEGKNENNNNEYFKENKYENKNENKNENLKSSSYPELNLGLDDMLKISKKLYLDRNEVLLIWEYILQIKKQFYFDFLFFNNPGKDILKEKINNNNNINNNKNTNSNYMFFNNFDLIEFLNKLFEEQNLIAIIITIISMIMYIISYKCTNFPKFNLGLLLIFLPIYYYFMDYLYLKRYYFCSFFAYFLTVFNIEKIWNTLFLLENPDEMEENLKLKNGLFDAFNFKTKGRFLRKLILSLIILILSIYFSFTKFRSFYFYLFQSFIIRLIRMIMIRYFKYNNDTPIDLQPFENFIDIILALFSLIISNFYYYSNLADSHDLLGLIVIYNLISFYYLTSLDKFLHIYRNGLSDIYFEYSCLKEKNENENSEKNQNQNKNQNKNQNQNKNKNQSENKNDENLDINNNIYNNTNNNNENNNNN